MPAIVGKNGVETPVPIELDQGEIAALRQSAEALRRVIDDVMADD